MAITYTWEVLSLKTKTEGDNQNAVVQTYWKKTGTDEHGHTASFDGATPFTSVNVPPGEFVPFENLTESTVLSWIQSSIDEIYEAHINKIIQEKLDEQHISQPGLPWDPTKGLPATAPQVQNTTTKPGDPGYNPYPGS